MTLRHKAGFKLLGKSLAKPPSCTGPSCYAVPGESPRRAVADGRVTWTQTGLLEASGPRRRRPRKSNWAIISFWQNRSRHQKTQFIWKRETIPSGTQVSGRNGLFEIHWEWELLLRMHRAFSCRELRVTYSKVWATCLAQMSFSGISLPLVGGATIFFFFFFYG